MSYQEIIAALQDNKSVHWYNKSYKVFLQGDSLYTIFTSNESMCKLQESEYKDCFVEGI